MNLKFVVAFILLFEILSASQVESKWEDGVNRHSESCSKSVDKFAGPSQEVGGTLYRSFISYITKLKDLTKCNSKIVSSKSIAILETISLMSKVGTSPSVIIREFSKVLRTVAAGHRRTVSSLSGFIGDLTSPVNAAISRLEGSLGDIIKEYQSRVLGKSVCSNEIDYEPVFGSIQYLANTIALIAETAEKNLCTDDVRESIVVLTLILVHFAIVTHGTTASIASLLYVSSFEASNTVQIGLQSVDSLLRGITDSISAITIDISESLAVLFTTLVNLIIAFNDTLKDVIGLFVGVAVTVAEITQSLSIDVLSSVTGITNGLGNIFGGACSDK